MQGDVFRRFGVIGGGVFFTIIGLAQPFFTLYAQALGASTLTIGILVTLRAALPIVIALPCGQLIDSLGPMRMLLYGMLCLIASLVLTVLAQDIWLLVASQLLLGASIIISASSLQVIVSAGDQQVRNEAIKRYSMWMSGGGMLGPLLGGLVVSGVGASLFGYRAAFAAAAVAALAFTGVLMVLSRSYPHPQARAGEGGFREVLSVGGVVASYRRGVGLTAHRPVQFGLTATFIIMYIQSMYSSFLPLYMDATGYSTMMISSALALQGLASMLSRFLLSGAQRRLSAEQILTIAGFVASACVALTPLAGPSTVALVAVVMLMGAALGLNLPVSIMIMVDAVGESERGKLMGLRLLVNRFSQILSPAMFGYIGHVFGLTAALYGGGAFLLATMCGFTAYTVRSLRS